MLTILITASSIIILTNNSMFWLVSIMTLMILSVFSLSTYASSSYFYISSWSSMDNMSIMLISLSFWITAMMIFASTKILNMDQYPKQFVMVCTTLLMVLINCFSASNLITFYIWFEASLIPTMMLILIWGYQPERMQASMYFMLYTVTASLPMLGAICKIYFASWTSSMPLFSSLYFPLDYTNMHLAWMLCIVGFLVKLPLYSVHLWLPKAHVEAPVAGSMILAAILLKLGGYGMLRMNFIFPFMPKLMMPLISSLALVGAVITSLICMRQSDLKSLIAYSSVGHMGLMVAAVMTSTKWGMSGALAMMIAHGLSSSALFVMANLNYESASTRSIFLSKGVMMFAPIMTMWWFLFTISNMAAPPSINLLSEIMLITSMLSVSVWSMIPLGLISFFTAGYSLYMYSAVNHGHSSIYSNPYPGTKSKEPLMFLCHLFPIIVLIMKPELITSWF